jgi:hypothetical protein
MISGMDEGFSMPVFFISPTPDHFFLPDPQQPHTHFLLTRHVLKHVISSTILYRQNTVISFSLLLQNQ